MLIILLMLLTNIFQLWTHLDTYKEKLCDLADHHFERKKSTRHVSTQVRSFFRAAKSQDIYM